MKRFKITYELESSCQSGCGFNYCNEPRRIAFTKSVSFDVSTEEKALKLFNQNIEKYSMHFCVKRNIRIISVEIIE
jgi:hypothetical protein